MKKIFKIATILLSVGLVLSATGCAVMGFNFKKLSNDNYTLKTHAVEEGFSKIEVDVDTSDVILLPSLDNTCKVECFDGEKRYHSVSVEEDTLKIVYGENIKWYDHIQVYSPDMYVKVYLPQVEYEEITLKGDTSDMTISDGVACGNVQVDSETGDVEIKGTVRKAVTVSVHTGDVSVEGVEVETVQVKTTTGDVELSSVTAKNVSVKVDTGEMDMEKLNVSEELRIESNTGDLEMEDCISGSLWIKTSPGDVELVRCDAAAIEIKTSTGDVKGTLLTGKMFDAKSSSGKVRVPQDSAVGGTCTITTSSGSINLNIV